MPSLIVSVIVLILVALISGISFFISVAEEDKGEKKFMRTYAIISILIFWLLGIFSLVRIENIPRTYLLFQLGFFILGCLHVWLLVLMHNWNRGHAFYKEFMYSLFIGSLGTTGFIGIFYLLNKTLVAKITALSKVRVPGVSSADLPLPGLETSTVFNTTPLLFLVPFLLYHAYLFWQAIPKRIYKRLMFFPNSANHRVYDRQHIRDKMQVQFLIQLTGPGNAPLRKVLATVDENYQFGGFFHVFVDEYNRKNHQNPIWNLDKDENGEIISWLFYKMPRFWLLGRKYIDPYTTFRANQIRKEDTIVALRILGNPEPEQLESLAPAQPINPPSSKITIRRKNN